MTREPRILVGTLFTGENEFEQCLESLQAQTYPHWEQIVLRNLPNKEAHDTLYSSFMNSSDAFDLFMKLDADMVFKRRDSLAEIIQLFVERPDLDHLQAVVEDWYSDSLIMGLHVYSNRVRWRPNDEKLFVDSSPPVQGTRWRLRSDPAPFAVHSPDPSPFQAFSFGVHRALKALQPDRKRLRLGQVDIQWELLENVWRHFVQSKDRRLGFAVLGADCVLRGKLQSGTYDYARRDILRCRFQAYRDLTSDELYDQLRKRWKYQFVRRLRFIAKMEPRYSMMKVYRFGRRFVRRTGDLVVRSEVS